MHILLTNDDGINSPLLRMLAEAAAARGHRVTISAPASQQSAKSHAFTISRPLFVRHSKVPGADQAFAVEGTPVDSCRLGFMMLAKEKVDLVISGINYGMNAGLATYVSGTVGAAREAAFQNLPAMAVSVDYDPNETVSRYFADYCIRTGEKLVQYDAPEKSVCNVNMPSVTDPAMVRGARICSISRMVYQDNYVRECSPRGDEFYWLKPMESFQQLEPDSDLGLLEQGYITVTFLTPVPVDQQTYADFPLSPEAN